MNSLMEQPLEIFGSYWFGCLFGGFSGGQPPDSVQESGDAADAVTVPRSPQLPGGHKHHINPDGVGSILLDQVQKKLS